jgi:hypothetical protein
MSDNNTAPVSSAPFTPSVLQRPKDVAPAQEGDIIQNIGVNGEPLNYMFHKGTWVPVSVDRLGNSNITQVKTKPNLRTNAGQPQRTQHQWTNPPPQRHAKHVTHHPVPQPLNPVQPKLSLQERRDKIAADKQKTIADMQAKREQ